MPRFDLSEFVQRFSYLGVYLWFAVLEQFTPIPEEASLISVGYVSIHADLNPVITGIVCVVGLLTTDFFLFFLAVKGNKIARGLEKKVNHRLLDKIKANLQKNAAKTLFVMALLPKVRFISPIVAGLSRIPAKTFIAVNSIATAFYVTVYVSIGILFHHGLKRLLHKMQEAQDAIFIAVVVAVAIIIALKIRKSMKHDNNDQ